MSTVKQIMIPGPDHPIAIQRHAGRLVVKVGGHVVADTEAALDLREGAYAVVHYVRREDVSMALLERTEHATYCPYKGDCVYYSIPVGGTKSVNAAWSYDHPYDAVVAIKNYVAFYTELFDSIEIGAQPNDGPRPTDSELETSQETIS